MPPRPKARKAKKATTVTTTTTTIISDPFPRVQLALSNPSQWNTEWETFYEKSPDLTKPDFIMQIGRSDRQRSMMFGRLSSNEEDKHGYFVNYQSTCQIQAHVGRSAINAFVIYDFERRWRAASVEERRKHALVGLANGGGQAKNLNAARSCCSDILRLPHLTEDPEVLLQLLRDVTPQDITFFPKEPYYFPNADWDAVRARQQSDPKTTEDEKFCLLEVLALRSKLIFLVLEGIMASFLGKPLPEILVYKEKDRRPDALKKQEIRFLKKEHELLYGEDGARRLREEFAAMDERKRLRRVYCENCTRPQGPDEKFMRCKKCWDEIGREVKYCRKECQAADWRARHKQFCGKAVNSMDEFIKMLTPSVRNLKAAEWPTHSRFGPPRNGFRRTPQLVHHIQQLDTKPDIDYVLQTAPGKKLEIEIVCPPVAKLFRAAQKVAFEEGERETTAKFCHYIIWFMRASLEDVRYEWDLNYAVDQMEKEFDFPDLRSTFKEMEELRLADPFHRPPLLFSLRYVDWDHYFLMDGEEDPIEGKPVLDRPMNETWEVKTEDSRVVLIPGIWEGPLKRFSRRNEP